MKKIIIALCLILTACALPKKEEKFVNPIFYNKLIGKWRKEQIHITPRTYYIQNDEGYFTNAKCSLLENTETSVTLKCLFMPANPKNKKELIIVLHNEKPALWIMKFTILPNADTSHITIKEQSYYNGDKEFLSTTEYTVDTQTNVRMPTL